jgi:hypothetical protein
LSSENYRLTSHLPLINYHWTINGANAIIALRCSKLSGRFEDFWERHSASVEAAA